MSMNKREFLKLSGAATIASALPGAVAANTGDTLRDMTAAAVPISVAERKARVAKAQKLMCGASAPELRTEPVLLASVIMGW